jgi:A/G-specific adenine glycosylase
MTDDRLGESFSIRSFQQDLLYWFERNLRDLPWRQDKDPYKIWVSEVMLQQTRVETVIPYFERFVARYPALADLAGAEEEEVLKLWEGLGYYSRARNLHAGVREVQENYAGRVPEEPELIRTIRGIGPYTAGAILSIAYGKPEPAVDGNVMRVLSRLFIVEEDIAKGKTRKLFEHIIRTIIAEENPSYFNQALMELGALLCTPKSPKCPHCPVHRHCQGASQGVAERLPVKGKAKPLRQVELAVAFLEHHGQVLLTRRPNEGLLAGMWELPNKEGELGELLGFLRTDIGIDVNPVDLLFTYQHTFTHLQWEMKVYHLQVAADQSILHVGDWFTEGQLDQVTLPVSFRRILNQVRQLQKRE